MAIGHRRRCGGGPQQRLQTAIEIIDSGEVVKHALIDAQARGS